MVCASTGTFSRCSFGHGVTVAAVCVRGGSNGERCDLVFESCTFGYGPHPSGAIEARKSPISVLSHLSCAVHVKGKTVLKMPDPGSPVYQGNTRLLCSTEAGEQDLYIPLSSESSMYPIFDPFIRMSR